MRYCFENNQYTGPNYIYQYTRSNGDRAEVTVESTCDPRLPNCLLPLQPRDSAFLTRVHIFYKDLNSISDPDERRECAEMFNKLNVLINASFNRWPGDADSTGIWRGNAAVGDGSIGFHAGATNSPGSQTVHIEGWEWDGIHQADSAHAQGRLVSVLLHETAHTLGMAHIPPEGVPLDYRNLEYFKYTIIDDVNSCVRPWFQLSW